MSEMENEKDGGMAGDYQRLLRRFFKTQFYLAHLLGIIMGIQDTFDIKEGTITDTIKEIKDFLNEDL